MTKEILFAFISGVLITVFMLSFFVEKWKPCLKKCCQKGEYIIKKWYSVVFYLLITLYVLINFKECKTLTFFDDFDGDNVIFILWLALSILPIFDKIEILGFGYKLRQTAAENAAYEAKKEIMTEKELQELNKKINNE